MRYVSTRGLAPAVGFPTVILDGLAPDGGLYVPASLQPFTAADLGSLRDADISSLTRTIVARFAGDSVSQDQLHALLGNAHARFTHPAITPLVQTDHGRWVMELFHGPTLAFKDLAMQVLAPMLGHFLETTDRSAMIIGATSGDTGGAALAAFVGASRVRALFLYPDGGVSTFQEAQMQSLSGPHLRAIPVSGTFDDCQRIVKALLGSRERDTQFELTAVNSVNWGRILAQTAYFARAALVLGTNERPVHFIVPTGNFGNLYAGILARRLGFAIGELVIATNENDSLHRIVQTGICEPRPVVRTNTPAMDIQVASNLERLVFDLAGDDAASTVRDLFAVQGARGPLALPRAIHDALGKVVHSVRISDEDTLAQIKATSEGSGYVADPHTAVALAAAQRLRLPPGEIVTLATAHPIKFEETVRQALGDFPSHLEVADRPDGTMPKLKPIAPDEGLVRAIIEDICAA